MDSRFNNEQKKILKKMKESYKDDRLIPFIGAGFSKNIEGYPGWGEFIQKLTKDIGVNLMAVFKNNYLEACEYYVWKKADELMEQCQLEKEDNPYFKGKEKLLEFVKEMVKEKKRNNREWFLHDLMVSKFDYIYTTNWDNTLEIAKPTPGRKKIKPIYRKSHLSDPDYAKDAIQIIKLHGHYDDVNAESLIACQKDYNKRIIEENPFDIKFKNDLLHNNFFFIGYNFGDPNILLMIDLIYQLTEGILPHQKVKIFWISTEIFGDQRVYLLNKSLELEPYYLFTKTQQSELTELKKVLEEACNSCIVKKKTNAHEITLFELCEKCDKPQRGEVKEVKKKLIKEQVVDFLNNFSK